MFFSAPASGVHMTTDLTPIYRVGCSLTVHIVWKEYNTLPVYSILYWAVMGKQLGCQTCSPKVAGSTPDPPGWWGE